MIVRRPSLMLIALGAALIALFLPVFFGQALYWGLPSLQFVPWRVEATHQLADGVFPFWNSLNGGGAPLFANYQSALLYPPGWLAFLTSPAWALSLLTVLHLFLAGWGMFALTRAIGCTSTGAAASALAFGAGSFLVARAGTYPIVMTAAWLPWLLFVIHRWLCEGRRSALTGASIITLLMLLAGHAQMAWYSFTLAGLYALWLVSIRRATPKRLPALVGAVILAILAASLQLVATGELLTLSQRGSGVERDFALNFSFAPARFLTLLNANALGTPADGSFVTGGAYFEDAVYVGLVPLVAAGFALLLAVRRRHNPDTLVSPVVFWALIGFTGVVLALGRHTPVFVFLYEYVPTFDLFQAPARWMLWLVCALAVLAAIGISWVERTPALSRWTRRLMAACLGSALVGVAGWLSLQSSGMTAALVLFRAAALTGVLGFVAGLFMLRMPPKSSPAYMRWSLLFLALIALDLVIASAGLNSTVPSALFEPDRSRSASVERTFFTEEVVRTRTFEQFFRFSDYRLTEADFAALRQSGLPNLNLLDAESLVNNFDPILPAGFVRYSALLNEAPHEGLFRAAGVTTVVGTDDRSLIDGSANVDFVTAACWYANEDDAWAALSDPTFDPREIVLLAGQGACDAPSDDDARVERTESGYRTESDTGGWLVVADTHYPGWAAYVDGQPMPIQRANGMFRAVSVSEGVHEIEFRYEPAWLLPGLVATGLGVAGMIALFVWSMHGHVYNRKRPVDA